MVKGERGIILLMTLVFILTLSAVALAYGYMVNQELRGVDLQLSEVQALHIAETGIERTMTYLQDDTDWSDDAGSSVIQETFGAGSYDISLSSATATNIVVQSTGTVGSGHVQIDRTIEQKLRRLPEAFHYAFFYGNLNDDDLDVTASIVINGGDAFFNGVAQSNVDGTLTVPDGGTVATTTGGLVYATGSLASLSGTYTEGTTPNDLPSFPTLDTGWYDEQIVIFDDLIADAEAASPGDLKIDGTTTYTLSGTVFAKKFEVKNSATITGSGILVATEEINVKDSGTVTPSAGNTITLITTASGNKKFKIEHTATVGPRMTLYAQTDDMIFKGTSVATDVMCIARDKKVKVEQDASLSDGCVLYSRDKVEIKDSATVGTPGDGRDGNAILSDNKVKVKDDTVTVKGLLYAGGELEFDEGMTLYGAIVFNKAKNDEIGTGPLPTTMTINYDASYLPEAPPGLGLDLDTDGTNEGAIVRVPDTWRHL